jgi:hypothetical protein
VRFPRVEPSLDYVRLVYPFDLGTLMEALVLYKNVHIFLDEDTGISSLVEFFTASGLLSFFEEFHETVTIHAHGYMAGIRGQELIVGTTRTFVPDTSLLDDMRRHRYVGGLFDPTSKLYRDHPRNPYLGSLRSDSRVDLFLQRIESYGPPLNFFELLLANPADLSRRFGDYLRAVGRPHAPGLRFAYERIEHHRVYGFEIFNAAGTKQPAAKRVFMDYLKDWIQLYDTRNASRGHLIVPGNGAFLLAYDSNLLLRRLLAAEEARDHLGLAVIPNVPRIAESSNHYAQLPDHLLKALIEVRRRRLSLADDVTPVDLIVEVSGTPWFNRLPMKVARWSVFTGAGVILDLRGAGIIGTVGGVGLSALDSFFLDRIADRWSPEQYLIGYRASLERLGTRLALGAPAAL